MESIKKLYKVGNGPSSSHTMGPKKAALIFKERYPDANKYEVELYGSLAETGKGHLTDLIIKMTLGLDKTEIIFKGELCYDYHSNGMLFKAYVNEEIKEWLVFSVGGGELKELGEKRDSSINDIYPHKNMEEILNYCENNNISFYEYVINNEEEDITDYANMIIDKMFASVERGIRTVGYLPGELHIERRASSMYNSYLKKNDPTFLAFASSLAVSEENANGGEIVTSPTCGSSGVVPGVLYTYYKHFKVNKEKLVKALLVGGLIGNIIKHNGSISGAEVGCQGEVGVACSMASAAVAYLQGGNNKQIEYASEIALEHHLGLTCDPVLSYVQIPCIERNAMSCKRAIDCGDFAMLTNGEHYIKLDDAIKTMLETGKDLNPSYKETSKGGLAKTKVC